MTEEQQPEQSPAPQQPSPQQPDPVSAALAEAFPNRFIVTERWVDWKYVYPWPVMVTDSVMFELCDEPWECLQNPLGWAVKQNPELRQIITPIAPIETPAVDAVRDLINAFVAAEGPGASGYITAVRVIGKPDLGGFIATHNRLGRVCERVITKEKVEYVSVEGSTT